MMAELGAQYLYFAIQVLHNACPAKGYTAHVLGYTLHAILETISKVLHAHHIVQSLISVLALSSKWSLCPESRCCVRSCIALSLERW